MKCYRCKKVVDDSLSKCPGCGALLSFTEELIQRAIDKDQTAIEQLYNMTSDNVYYSIKTMIKNEDVVMDIMQDTYLKAFASLSQLKEPAAFRGWIKRIAHNKTVDYLRKAKPVMFSEMVSVDSDEMIDFKDERTASMPEEVMDQKETSRLIGEILDGLSEEQRTAVGMFYFDNMSVKEIADVLDVSENTVKSRLNYARKNIGIEVKALEKKGTKLYNLAPIPFLLWLFKSEQAYATEIPASMVLEGITAGSTVAGSTVAGTTAKAGIKAVLTKAIAGVTTVAVIGTGVAVYNNNQKIEEHYISDFTEISEEYLYEMVGDTTDRYDEFLSSDKTIDVKDGEQDFTFWREHISNISETEVLDKGYFAYKTDPSGYEANILYVPCSITVDNARYTDFTGSEATVSFDEAICVYKLRNIYMNSDGSIVYDEAYVEQTCFYESEELLKEMEFTSLEYAYEIEEVNLK